MPSNLERDLRREHERMQRDISRNEARTAIHYERTPMDHLGDDVLNTPISPFTIQEGSTITTMPPMFEFQFQQSANQYNHMTAFDPNPPMPIPQRNVRPETIFQCNFGYWEEDRHTTLFFTERSISESEFKEEANNMILKAIEMMKEHRDNYQPEAFRKEVYKVFKQLMESLNYHTVPVVQYRNSLEGLL